MSIRLLLLFSIEYPNVKLFVKILICTVKLGDKERFDKEQIGVKEPFPVTNLSVYFIRIRNNWHQGTILG